MSFSGVRRAFNHLAEGWVGSRCLTSGFVFRVFPIGVLRDVLCHEW